MNLFSFKFKKKTLNNSLRVNKHSQSLKLATCDRTVLSWSIIGVGKYSLLNCSFSERNTQSTAV